MKSDRETTATVPVTVTVTAPTAMVAAAQAGSRQAQDDLIAAYLPLVYNIVGRALDGHPDVDDVVQETMLHAVDGLGRLRDPANFRSWLVAIAMNQVRRHWHTRRAAPQARGLREALDVADPGADFVDVTIARLGLSGQRREVAQATRWLDPDDRALLSLWWLEAAGELTRTELATAVELSQQHTAVRVQRMKAQLEAARIAVRALVAVPPCADLQSLTKTWNGIPTALWRKRLARHARECAACAGHGSGLVPAERLLVGLALIPPTAGLATLIAAARRGSGIHQAGIAAYDFTSPGGRQQPQAMTRSASRHSHRRGGNARHSRHGLGGSGHRVIGTAVGAVGVTAIAAVTGVLYSTLGTGSGISAHSGRPAIATAPSSAPPATTTGQSLKPSAAPPKSTQATQSTSAPSQTTTPTPTHSPSTGASASTQPGGASDPVQQVLALINKARAAQGLPPYTITAGLTSSSQAHNQRMASGCGMSHQCPGEADLGTRETAAGVQWSAAGENIGEGGPVGSSNQSIASMALGLTQSMLDEKPPNDGHRRNILSTSFTHMGIAVQRDAQGTVWLTQDFSN